MARSNPRSSRGRRWLAGFSALVLVAMTALIPAASVSAAEPTNMVLVWNENAINVLGAPQAPPVTTPPTAPGLGQGPPLSPLHLAMVHGAIYDAVNAIDGGHEPYLDGLSAPAIRVEGRGCRPGGSRRPGRPNPGVAAGSQDQD